MRRIERQLITELFRNRFTDGEVSCTRDHEGKLTVTTLVYSKNPHENSLEEQLTYVIDENQLNLLRRDLLFGKINSLEEFSNFLIKLLDLPDTPGDLQFES